MSTEQSAETSNSTGSIDTNQAGALFASLISPEPRDTEPPAGQEPPAATEAPKADDKPLTEEEALEKAAAEEANAEPAQKAESDTPVKFTVKIDGKDVELTPEEVAEAYKGQLRQADYTRKTTEAAEQRKAAEAKAAQAEAELTQARQERTAYAHNLQLLGQRLQGVMQEQAQIDWQRLSVENPAEYVKQRHLFDQRQAQLAQIQGEQARIAQLHQAEQERAAKESQQAQAKAREAFRKEQQDKLLAKFPHWSDAAKAQAEKTSIAQYLAQEGYAPEEIDGVEDHRAVVLAQKAMKYDQLMAKAKVATTRVDKLPVKVERPGTATATNPADGRTAAMQRLSRTGDVTVAGEIFATMFK